MDECKEVAKIINKYLDSNNLKEISHINECDIDPTSFSDDNNYIQWNSKIVGEFKHEYLSNNKLDKLFNQIERCRKNDRGQFYHFKPFDIACDIIKHGEIQLTSLSKQKDLVEYSEFLNRYCHNPLLDDQHIDDAKKDIYIFCFTKHFRNERFWKEYAKDHTGVCLVFRFNNFLEILDPSLYHLLDVIYDNEILFDFINHIQDEIFDKFGKHIFIGADRAFARHFKRACYSWESEIRMIFDFHENRMLLNTQFGVNVLDLNKYIKKETDDKTGRRYIRLPFENPFFKFKIDEIICGKEVCDVQLDYIKKIAPDINNVWRIPKRIHKL